MPTPTLDLPPEELIFVGDGDFVTIGNEFLRYFIDPGGLQPFHRVLDVGCGIGRMAIPLTRYLDRRGSYEGFDIVPAGIDWCRTHLTPRFPAFRFQHADIRNASYNPDGRHRGEDYRFPYPDASFDFAFLTSVFTHMLPEAVEHYLDELARVLESGGRCLMTCFLWNPESAALTLTGRSALPFHHRRGVHHLADPNQPENAVSFNEDYFLQQLVRRGFRVDRPLHYGSWCGRTRFLSSQDIVVATRTEQRITTAPESATVSPSPLEAVVEAAPAPAAFEVAPAVRKHIEGRLRHKEAAFGPDGAAAVAAPVGERGELAAALRQVSDLEERLRETQAFANQLHATLIRIYASHSWALLNRYYAVRNRLLPPDSRRRKLAQSLFRQAERLCQWVVGTKAAPASDPIDLNYTHWLTRHEPSAADLDRQRGQRFARMPRVSLLLRLSGRSVPYLSETLNSLVAQTYAPWELHVAVEPTVGELARRLLRRHADRDRRIHVFAVYGSGLAESLGRTEGEFVAFLAAGDTLAPGALHAVARAVNEQPDADLIYSDEDHLDAAGQRCRPHFKPDWSPDTLRSHDYLGRLAVIRRPLVDPDAAGAALEYACHLRAGEQARRVVHLPQIHYHRRLGAAALPEAAACAALLAHLRRGGSEGEVVAGPHPNTFQVRRVLPGRPLVSILIPTRDQQPVLARCLESIRRSTYDHYEILLVENDSRDPATFAYYRQLEGWPRVRLLTHSGPFNYSAVNNQAARAARGEVLLLLNNDTEVLTADWLERLLEHALRPEVGAVGAKLYYPDGTIQHAGVILGLGGVAGHSHRFLAGQAPGHGARLWTTQNLSAVTGACLMLRKQLYDDLGGLDERYGLAYNDVDLCLRLRRQGYAILWTPYAELIHHESKTRGSDDTPEKKIRFAGEIRTFLGDWWREVQDGDPFYNPNLTLDSEDFALRG